MSAQGYSDRLSKHSYRGRLNLQSDPDPPRSVLAKARILADRIRSSSHVVLHTGAGISTAAGIRDFRGPDGVWTTEARHTNGPSSADGSTIGTSFENAIPTLTHMAIQALHEKGFVQYVISQNVDGLHLRSGLPRLALSELHGNLFVNWCPVCESETIRDSEVTTVGYKPVGRRCKRSGCDGVLTDKALDWNDELPFKDLDLARKHGEKADLALILGTSCQMDPARGLPFRGKADVVIVNLSRTEYDKRAAFTIRATTDAVFAVVAQLLNVRVPTYERKVDVVVSSVLQEMFVSGVSKGVCLEMETRVKRDGRAERRTQEISGVAYRKMAQGEDEKDGKWIEGAKCGGYVKLIYGRRGTRVEARISLRGEEGDVTVKHVGPGMVERTVVVRRKRYDEEVEQKVSQLEEDAKRSRKRKRGENWEIRHWFVKGSRRGWQTCVLCKKEVWSGAGKREAHFALCNSEMDEVICID